MKALFIIVFNSILSMNIFASGIQGDSVKVIAMKSKVDSLINVYNYKDCPKNVVDQLCQLYKDEAKLSELYIPFTSFNCVPIQDGDGYVGIKLHPNLYYDDNRIISMKSKDGGCLAFFDIFPLSLSTLIGTSSSNVNVRNKLLEDIISNKTGQPRWLALKSVDIDFEKIYDKQVDIYTANSQIAQNCNADTIYVCSFTERENIGYYTNIDSAHREFNTLNDYKTAYKIVLTSHDQFPVYLFLFCKKKGDKVLKKYLDDITKSIRFF